MAKRYSVIDILNENNKARERKIEDNKKPNFKSIDLNDEKDIYTWANYWREEFDRQKKEKGEG